MNGFIQKGLFFFLLGIAFDLFPDGCVWLMVLAIVKLAHWVNW